MCARLVVSDLFRTRLCYGSNVRGTHALVGAAIWRAT